jgi:hypothetical protein
MSTRPGHPGLKAKVRHELEEYLLVSAYMIAFIGAFTLYRHLILAEYGVYFSYGSAIIEGLILGKIVLIGQALHVGERETERPLIWTTLRKSLLFGLLFFAFTILETTVKRLIHHEPLFQAFAAITPEVRNEALARAIMMFVALIPFFAFGELRKHFGAKSLVRLFFGGRGSER